MRRLHLVLAGAWAFLLIPTLIWWKASILWVATMSLYANFVGHWSAYQAARAEDNGNDSGTRKADPVMTYIATHRKAIVGAGLAALAGGLAALTAGGNWQTVAGAALVAALGGGVGVGAVPNRPAVPKP